MKKNKKGKVKVVVAILFMLLILTTSTASFADVGGFDRYDSGDSGWSSYDSGSSWSSYDSGSSWSSGSYSSSSKGRSGKLIVDDFITIFLFLILPVALIIYSKYKQKENGQKNSEYMPNRKVNEYEFKHMDRTGTVTAQVQAVDPEFSAEKFLAWSKEVYIKLQTAWTKKDWTVIRPFESNELFQQHVAQLQEFIDSNKTNVMEKISIRSAAFTEFRRDGQKEKIKVFIRVVQRDYVIDDETQEVIEGNKEEDRYMKYVLTFVRKQGVKTRTLEGMSTTNCPNCGAPTKVTSAGQCEYCDSVITTGDHDWVLTNIEGMQDSRAL